MTEAYERFLRDAKALVALAQANPQTVEFAKLKEKVKKAKSAELSAKRAQWQAEREKRMLAENVKRLERALMLAGRDAAYWYQIANGHEDVAKEHFSPVEAHEFGIGH